ncbi:hypothetical protein Prudu_012326, partial [Prunus dulcis]
PPFVPSYRNSLPSDMTMSTDIQFTFSFVSALHICLTSFGNAQTAVDVQRNPPPGHFFRLPRLSFVIE